MIFRKFRCFDFKPSSAIFVVGKLEWSELRPRGMYPQHQYQWRIAHLKIQRSICRCDIFGMMMIQFYFAKKLNKIMLQLGRKMFFLQLISEDFLGVGRFTNHMVPILGNLREKIIYSIPI